MQVGFQFTLVSCHLLENFPVHVRDGIDFRRFRFGRICGRPVGQRAPRQHGGQLRGVVRPRRQHLRTLVQIAFPHFVEGVRLAVVRFRIFRTVLNAKESWNAHLVERGVIGSKGARHARLHQLQISQRSENLVHNFPILVVVVQSERQHAAGARIVYQHGGNLLQVIPVGFHVLHGTDEPFFFSGE